MKYAMVMLMSSETSLLGGSCFTNTLSLGFIWYLSSKAWLILPRNPTSPAPMTYVLCQANALAVCARDRVIRIGEIEIENGITPYSTQIFYGI